MRVQNYHLLSELPDPGPPGSAPPLSAGELLMILSDRDVLQYAAERVFLMDDLLMRDAFLSGESSDPSGLVLTRPQMRGQAALPDYLAPPAADGSTGRSAVDGVWAAYFQHLTDAAAHTGIRFLAEWAAFEVSLRNALAAERARRLSLEPGAYLVATHIGFSGADAGAVAAEWSAAANPLAAQRMLDAARWHWLVSHDYWYSFSHDEVAAYAAKLQLVIRAYRIVPKQENVAPGVIA